MGTRRRARQSYSGSPLYSLCMSLVRYVGIGRQSDFSVQFLRLGLDTHSQAVHVDISWVLILAVKQLLSGILDFVRCPT